jgi:hypothetical protein
MIIMKMPNTCGKLGAILLLSMSVGVAAAESPHWKKSACQTCHLEATPTDGAITLQAENAEVLCQSCHGGSGDATPCRHASGLPVGDRVIDEDLVSSLSDGQVVCTTCHEIEFQCRNATVYGRYENPPFLRDRTSMRSAEYCAKCHAPAALQKFNPHDGVAGTPPKRTCLLCHETTPKSDASGGILVSFNMKHDINDQCRGCHNVAPHPRNLFASNGVSEWAHLVVPPDEIKTNMEAFEQEYGVVLPLSREDGKITCSTCHNQHGFVNGGAAKLASTPARHRLRAQDICQVCHEK